MRADVEEFTIQDTHQPCLSSPFALTRHPHDPDAVFGQDLRDYGNELYLTELLTRANSWSEDLWCV